MNLEETEPAIEEAETAVVSRHFFSFIFFIARILISALSNIASFAQFDLVTETGVCTSVR